VTQQPTQAHWQAKYQPMFNSTTGLMWSETPPQAPKERCWTWTSDDRITTGIQTHSAVAYIECKIPWTDELEEFVYNDEDDDVES
jgi:hypothetical protein